MLIARTGYTAEDGFEIYVPTDEATSARVWNEVLEAGKEFGIVPCGLGARNTLRLEGKLSLYGHEISERHQRLGSRARPLPQDGQRRVHRPRGAGEGESRGIKRTLVGLESIERGIPRDGYQVLDLTGKEIGYVTSGSYAPFLKKNIALAYVPVEQSADGTRSGGRNSQPAGEVQGRSDAVLQASEEAVVVDI